jgi:FkbM family methyltransferase
MKIIQKATFYLKYPKQFFHRLKGILSGTPMKHMEVEDFVSILPENAVILEAGASRGMDTVKFARLWPHGRIHAFEPEPSTFGILTEETKMFPNVKRHPLALSTETGTASFHVSSRDGVSNATDASSLLKPTSVREVWDTLEFAREIEVRTITLSDFMREERIKHIDFMWLDMQGMEIKCLLASADVLARVDRIYMEVFLKPLYEDAPLYPEVRRAMLSAGFRPVREFLNPIIGDVLFERAG